MPEDDEDSQRRRRPHTRRTRILAVVALAGLVLPMIAGFFRAFS